MSSDTAAPGRNAWTSGDEPLATWNADLTPSRSDANTLARWTSTVLRAGEDQDVYTVLEAPLAGFTRQSAGSPFSKFLEQQFERKPVVNMFQFASSGMREINQGRFRVVARLAFFDSAGAIREEDIDDVGGLLRGLGGDIDNSPGLVKRGPPIWAQGPRIDFTDAGKSVWDGPRDRVVVRFSILSEIWLPFVRGFWEKDWEDDLRYDNRRLAERHTPRLNEFLRASRRATELNSGEWTLDQDNSHPGIAYMLSADGVNLRAAPPAGFRIREPQ